MRGTPRTHWRPTARGCWSARWTRGQFLSNGKALLALDAATGQDIWRYATIGHSLSAATLADGVAYFSSSDGLLHAVDAASGQARWQVRHASWGPDAPAADASFVYAGGRGDALVAYAIGDGAEQWRFSAAAWFASPLCLAEGQLYTLNWDGFLYALEARTGRLLWKLKGERGQGFTSPPVARFRPALYRQPRVPRTVMERKPTPMRCWRCEKKMAARRGASSRRNTSSLRPP